MEITHCVIGSGPAGVACATALLARGARVLMLDAGLELEPELARVIRPLADKSPGQFTARDLQSLRGNQLPTAKGLPRKLIFGSDFPYRDTETEIPWQPGLTSLEPSLALGGFSNVWGAAMLPYRDADLAGWPVKNAELAPHYRAVTAFTGLAGQMDDLAELFPLYCDEPHPLRSSRQAELFLGHLHRHREPLRAAGWHFGRSRLAVRAAATPAGGGCQHCGLCMSGCPYGCIFNSADTVRQLQTRPGFTYQRDAIVTTLTETGGRVDVRGFDHRTRAPLALTAHRVYLASGVIPTAQILLRSQGDFDQSLHLRDSQYFLFPLLLARRTPGLPAEALHTLSQAFLELNDPAVSPHTIHLQVYSYSDIINQAPDARPAESPGPPAGGADARVSRIFAFRRVRDHHLDVAARRNQRRAPIAGRTPSRNPAAHSKTAPRFAAPVPPARRAGAPAHAPGAPARPRLPLRRLTAHAHRPRKMGERCPRPAARLEPRPRRGCQCAAQHSGHHHHVFRNGQRPPHWLGDRRIMKCL